MVNWDLLDEPWDSIGTWLKRKNGTSEISPAGQLHQVPLEADGYVGRYRDIGTLPNDYTVEFKLKIDVFGKHHRRFYDGIHYIEFEILSDKIRFYKGGGLYDEYSVSTDTNWHVWRLVIDSDGHSCKVYRDSSYVNEFTNFYNYTSGDGLVEVWMKYVTGGEMHEDYFRIATGLYSPGVTLSGVTRDANGNPLGGCTVWLFKTSDKNFVAETTSDANGNYSFEVVSGVKYFIRAHKDGTPNVFGTTDDNLSGS